MKKTNLLNKILVTVLTVAVLGAYIPAVWAYGNAQFNNAIGDYPTLQAGDHTLYSGSSNWSTNVWVNPSDAISFMIFYHNTSVNTAVNTRAQLYLPSTLSSGMSVTTTVTADNASPVQGSVTFYLNSGASGSYPLSYISGSAQWYNGGSTAPTSWLYGQSGNELVNNSSGVQLGDIPAGGSGYIVVRAQLGGSSNYYNYGTGPSISTSAATNVVNTSATLNATIYPNGYDTTAWFQYGTTASLGYTTQAQDVGAVSSVPTFNSNVYNLTAGTTYYYRAVAQNAYGTNYGSILTFNTPAYYNAPTYYNYNTPNYYTPSYSYYPNPPSSYNYNYVTSASGSGSTFTITGTAYPNGYNTTAWFEYGTTPSFGYTTPAQNVDATTGSVPVSAALTNLLPNTTYYYRLDVQNPYGSNSGSTLTFTTSAATYNSNANSTASGVGTSLTSILNSMDNILLSMKSSYSAQNTTQTNNQAAVATAVASTPTVSVTVTGTAYPNGSQTSAWFQYGPTASFGYTTSAQDVGSGNSGAAYSATITGLTPNTTYYYRTVARNAYGSGYGSTLTFTTPGASNSSNQSNYSTASIFSALGGNWAIIGLIILVLIGIGVVIFLRFVLK